MVLKVRGDAALPDFDFNLLLSHLFYLCFVDYFQCLQAFCHGCVTAPPVANPYTAGRMESFFPLPVCLGLFVRCILFFFLLSPSRSEHRLSAREDNDISRSHRHSALSLRHPGPSSRQSTSSRHSHCHSSRSERKACWGFKAWVP